MTTPQPIHTDAPPLPAPDIRTTEPAKCNWLYVVELTYVTVDAPPMALFTRRNRDQRTYRPAGASLRRLAKVLETWPELEISADRSGISLSAWPSA